jgi:ABC-type amino acid transport system permease subunit
MIVVVEGDAQARAIFQIVEKVEACSAVMSSIKLTRLNTCHKHLIACLLLGLGAVIGVVAILPQLWHSIVAMSLRGRAGVARATPLFVNATPLLILYLDILVGSPFQLTSKLKAEVVVLGYFGTCLFHSSSYS